MSQREIDELNNRIKKCYEKIDETCLELGRRYFNTKSGNPDEEFAPFCKDVVDLQQQISDMETRIKFINGIVVCLKCGRENGVKSSFCADCGARLPHTYVSTGGNRCPKCGNEVNTDQRFCGVCGTNVAEAMAAAAEEAPVPVNEELFSNFEYTQEEQIIEEQKAESSASACPQCGTPIKVADALFCAECGMRFR